MSVEYCDVKVGLSISGFCSIPEAHKAGEDLVIKLGQNIQVATTENNGKYDIKATASCGGFCYGTKQFRKCLLQGLKELTPNAEIPHTGGCVFKTRTPQTSPTEGEV